MPGAGGAGLAVSRCWSATIVVAHEVIPGDAIAATEAFLERPLLIAGNIGMTEGVVPIEIGIAAMLVVIASGIDAVAEAIAADIIVPVGKGIPTTAAVDPWWRTICRRWRCHM
jgi:hypothetical protein